MSFRFFRQFFAFTIFFCFAMFAFVMRHHGDKVPSCAEYNATLHANETEKSAEHLVKAAGGIVLLNTSGFDELGLGPKENSRMYSVFNNFKMYKEQNHIFVN